MTSAVINLTAEAGVDSTDIPQNEVEAPRQAMRALIREYREELPEKLTDKEIRR